MVTRTAIWRDILWMAPVRNQDGEYIQSQARILKLDQDERLNRLWQVCEEQADIVLEVFEAWDRELISRQQIEQLLAGTLPVARVRYALAEFAHQTSESDSLV